MLLYLLSFVQWKQPNFFTTYCYILFLNESYENCYISPKNLILTSVNPFWFISSFLSRLFSTSKRTSLTVSSFLVVHLWFSAMYVQQQRWHDGQDICNLVTQCRHDTILITHVSSAGLFYETHFIFCLDKIRFDISYLFSKHS